MNWLIIQAVFRIGKLGPPKHWLINQYGWQSEGRLRNTECSWLYCSSPHAITASANCESNSASLIVLPPSWVLSDDNVLGGNLSLGTDIRSLLGGDNDLSSRPRLPRVSSDPLRLSTIINHDFPIKKRFRIKGTEHLLTYHNLRNAVSFWGVKLSCWIQVLIPRGNIFQRGTY